MTFSSKECTPTNRCQATTAREAWYCQVHHSHQRLDAIARLLGMSASSLSDAVNPNDDGSMLAARHHAPVLELTPDNLAVLNFYARKQNAVVYALPSSTVDATTAKVVREFGEMLTKHAEAYADRAISNQEAEAIRREGEEAIAAIVALMAEAERDAASGAKR
jgi:hypothetical protein